MNGERVRAVADAIAALGYDGIVAFDETEPEYGALQRLYEACPDASAVTTLAVCATTQDYQLNGDAQEFWAEFERLTLDRGCPATGPEIRALLDEFMDADINSRLNRQKRDRLDRLWEAGFDEWLLEHDGDVDAVTVWKRLAGALGSEMRRKTVVLPVKVYDEAHLIRHGEYLELPRDVPIPCDL